LIPFLIIFRIQLIITSICLLIFPPSIVLAYLGSYVIDKQRRGFFRYLFSAISSFFAIVYVFILIFLFFYSFKIFYRLYKHASLEQKTKSFFKERVKSKKISKV